MTLIEGIPDDLFLLCLARVHLSGVSQASNVCSHWKKAFKGSLIQEIRKENNLCENVVITWSSSKIETLDEIIVLDATGTPVSLSPFTISHVLRTLEKILAISEFETMRKKIELNYSFRNLIPDFGSMNSLHSGHGACEYLKFVESTKRLWNFSYLQEFKSKKITIWSENNTIFTVAGLRRPCTEIAKWCDNDSCIEIPDPSSEYETHGCVVLKKRLHVFRSDFVHPSADSGRLDIYDMAKSTWTTVGKVTAPFLKYYRGSVTVCGDTILGLLSTGWKHSLGRVIIARLDTKAWSWCEIAELPEFHTDEGIAFIDTCYLASFSNRVMVFCNGCVTKRRGPFATSSVSRNWINILEVSKSDAGKCSWIVTNKEISCPVESFALMSL